MLSAEHAATRATGEWQEVQLTAANIIAVRANAKPIWALGLVSHVELSCCSGATGSQHSCETPPEELFFPYQ